MSGPLDDLSAIAAECYKRWDRDMKPGKLLLALAGGAPGYDARVDRIRMALAKSKDTP